MAQLSRARDRSMHSIVATIQAEQDKAIRAPGKGVVSISGGPGTGKTVVALHRAAYLLYNDRRRYESGGVLIVGPSGVFMRYIERVLPSLGETAVALRSLGEVVDGLRAVPSRRPGRRRRQGLGPDGRADAPRRPPGRRPGQPDRVPAVLPRRQPRPRPAGARPDPPPAAVARAGATGSCRGSPRRCSTPCGARSAASAAASGSRGVRRRDARQRRLRPTSRSMVAAARRRRRCWAGCATPSSSPASATAWSATRTGAAAQVLERRRCATSRSRTCR